MTQKCAPVLDYNRVHGDCLYFLLLYRAYIHSPTFLNLANTHYVRLKMFGAGIM